jgi:hypothetical protein
MRTGMRGICGRAFAGFAVVGFALAMAQPAFAQQQSRMSGLQLDGDQPIEIESDRLEVRDNDGTAVFTGNVQVVQGETTLRAGRMVVHYVSDGSTGASTPSTGASDIERIEVEDTVYIETATQVATGGFIGRLVGIFHHQFVVAIDDGRLLGHAIHDVLEDRLGIVEFGLLREVADGGALGEPGFARPVLVEPGHDLEHGRLAGTVRAQNADLGIGVERQMEVLEHLLGAIGLGQAGHVIDELACHGARRTPFFGIGGISLRRM